LLHAELIKLYVNAVRLPRQDEFLISEDYIKEVTALKELTWTYVIEASGLAAQQLGHRVVIQRLFEIYSAAAEKPKRWGLFPPFYREQLKHCNSQMEQVRIVVDLIAGMTEPQRSRCTDSSQEDGHRLPWRKSFIDSRRVGEPSPTAIYEIELVHQNARTDWRLFSKQKFMQSSSFAGLEFLVAAHALYSMIRNV